MLDSEGVGAVARNTEIARAALDMARTAGTPVLVPSVVLAECLRGNRTDAGVHRVLAAVSVVSIGRDLAMLAAELKAAARMRGIGATIDALVVAVAVSAGGAAILTCHRRDLGALASTRSDVTVRVLRA